MEPPDSNKKRAALEAAVELVSKRQRVREEEFKQQQQETMRRQKQECGEDARFLMDQFKGDPKYFRETYDSVSKNMREALNALLVLEQASLSPEVREQFQHVLKPSTLTETISRRAFDAHFHGDGPKRFYEALNGIHQTEQFARVVGLFQASGWGKSRLVKELHGQGVWVVYLSLGTGTCFPKRSLFADEFEGTLRTKIGYGGLEGEVQCMNYCLAFWICCIRALAEHAPTTTPAEFVAMMAHDCGKDFWPLVHGLMESESARISETCPVVPEVRVNRLEFLNSWDIVAGQVFRDGISKSLLPGSSSPSLKLLFVIDEARQLLPDQGLDQPVVNGKPGLSENLYIPMRRSTRALTGSLVLFMDTTSRVANFLGPEWKEPSARCKNPSSGFFLAAPLVGFFQGDVGRKQRTGVDKTTFRNACEDREMARFGRPLWWSLYEASLPEQQPGSLENHHLEEVIGLAGDKLTGQTRGLWGSDEARISIVGSRCGLYVDPSSQLVADLVARHAMTVLYVSPDRNRVYAAWPVEPLLAEAAFREMQRIKTRVQNGYRVLYEPIQRKLSEGLLHIGELGELAGRIILLEVIDNVRERQARAWISVEELLRELFGSEIIEGLIESAAVYQKQKLQVVLQGKLLVNAFHRVYKSSSGLSFEDLRMGLEARCGIVAAAGTWGVDFLIPVHLGDLDESLNQTLVHIQLKNHERCGSIELAKLSSQYSGINLLRPGVPYLSLFINLKGAKKVELKQPHAVWEAVANSKDKVIVAALQVLEEDGTLRKLRMNVKDFLAALEGLKEGGKGLEELVKEFRAGLLSSPADPATNNKNSDSGRSAKLKGKVADQEAHKRWQRWIKADWSDQIIVRARGLDAFNLNSELKACLVDMLNIQVQPSTMHRLTPSILSEDDKARFAVTQNNWQLQQEMVNGMFGFRNVEQLVWQK